MASVPKRVSDRLSKETGKFQRILKSAKDRDINEADTVTIVTEMLESIFGYDKFMEITSEYAIRGTFCDLAIKTEGSVKYLIEVKAIGLDLREPHLRQVVGYGAQQGIQWVVLTNGIDWEIYRIKFEKPVSHDLLCSFDFLNLSPRKKEDQEILFLLCKEALAKAVIEDEYERIKSVNKFVISAILQSEPALNLIRRELRRVSPGLQVATDEIESILISDVIKRDAFEGSESEEAKARVKKASSRQLKKRRPKPKAEHQEIVSEESTKPLDPNSSSHLNN
jgi:hypothetical protein